VEWVVTEGAREQQDRGIGGMSRRTAAWLVSWSIWTLCLALVALTGLLAYLTPTLPGRFEGYWLFPNLGFFPAMIMLVYPTVGALIASRRPGNPIGWLFCLVGLVVIVVSFATAYASYAVYAPSSPTLPATQYAAWLADRDTLSTGKYWVLRFYIVQSESVKECIAIGFSKKECNWNEHGSGIAFPAMFLVLSLLLLLFPDGRLPSRKWSVAALTAIIGSVLLTLWWTTQPGPLYLYPSIDNPFGIWGRPSDIVEVGGRLSWVVAWGSLIASMLSSLSRWMEAEGEERQQMKWFGCALLLLVFAYPLSPRGLLLFIVLALLPVAVGIAILKYGLYHLDIIINRALVYGILTAMLALVYFGGVTATHAAIRAFTGQQEQPQLVIVVSTLIIAALFNPLRRRIQGFIDRLFYRRKYDARKTLEDFSAKLRSETDLGALSDDLVGVVRETMQPEHVSLWLRPNTAQKGSTQTSHRRVLRNE
jgi:hypothetical protein